MQETNFAAPIACSLDGKHLTARLERIDRLAKNHLLSERQDGLTLRLLFASEAADELQSIVELERQCCPFLVFDLSRDGSDVELAITAPAASVAPAATLYNHLRGAVSVRPAPGCAGSGCGCAA